MTYTQRIAPNLGQKSGAGDCLWFTWQAFGAPPGLGFGFAREAWDGQHGRHPGELPPAGVMVPVWFDHYGTYGSPARYGNWGHAAVSLGDGRILSSPATNTFGQTIFASIGDLERRLRATYLGWSECMDDTPVVVPTPKPAPAPVPETKIITEEIMAFRSVAIGYRPAEKEDRIITTALDFEDGQRLSEVAMTKDAAVAFFGKLTDGGFSILSEGHYKKVVGEFDAAVAEKREHELAVARASAGK